MATLLTGLSCLGVPAQAADAEYRLAAGDVVELSVAGYPDLSQPISVNVDGQVGFPLIGALKGAGLTIRELQATVRDQMPKQALRQRTEGKEHIIVLDPQEIVLRISQYRPVYVIGNVAKPGELNFRPGMTVRQALALGGGIGSARSAGGDSGLETSDLRAQHLSLAAETAAERTRVARIEAELGGKPPPPLQSLLSDLRLPESVLNQIANTETEQLRVRQSDLDRESEHLGLMIQQAEARLGILKRQLSQEDEGINLDTADFERLRTLFDKGMVPATRLSDARRSVLLSSTRKLQTDAELMQVERLREEVRRRLERLREERRLELLSDQQISKVRLTGLEAKLVATREKLALAGDLSLMLRDDGRNMEIVIFRTGAGAEVSISAEASTILAPGDVVQVSVPSESYTAQIAR